MSLTMREFEAGIAYWRDRKNWPFDFHNSFYGALAEQNPCGDFTEAWWTGFSRHLSAWKAIRPARPADVTTKTLRALPTLRAAWAESCGRVADRDVSEVSWTSVERFPTAVRELKQGRSRPLPVRSPVFTAKFCHFLLPAVFPVVDGAVMGLPFGSSYRAHIEGVQREWAATPEATRQDLHAALIEKIGAPLAPGYPLTNKAVELCLIGRRH